jgi:hypothetical protein
MITSETMVYRLFFRESMLRFFSLGVPHLFWANKRLFIGIEKKLVVEHNFMPVGIIS